jgi:hypothetical protein
MLEITVSIQKKKESKRKNKGILYIDRQKFYTEGNFGYSVGEIKDKRVQYSTVKKNGFTRMTILLLVCLTVFCEMAL